MTNNKKSMPNRRQPLLLIDDDPMLGDILRANLDGQNVELHQAYTGHEGLELSRTLKPDLVILDLGLPDTTGLKVLEELRASQPQLPVIILSGSTDVPTVVDAMRLGAFHYLTKPLDSDTLPQFVRLALENRRLLTEVRELRERRSPVSLMSTLMGTSPQVVELARQVSQVALTDFTVLIAGETGAGKELIAQALHRQSTRAAGPLIALDCGAIPDNLIESELFGHERGAFTGADRKRLGQIQLAEGGTLFLDEIGNLSPAMQVKLLRVMESRQLTPLGGGRSQGISVRFLAATNADLAALVQAGQFREDLLFRLTEYTIAVPPLRNRPADIPYLARRFVSEAALELRKPVIALSPEALAVLQDYHWPGNVRQLRNTLRRAVLQCSDFAIDALEVQALLSSPSASMPAVQPQASASPAAGPGGSLRDIAQAAADAAQRNAILLALQSAGGNKSAAARQLRTDYKTLHIKIQRLGIKPREE